MQIQNVAELEEVLSRPYEEDVAAMRDLDGDLLLLGVAGKMGPSLALRAVRAMREAGSKGRVIGVSRFSNPAARTQLDEAGVGTIAADLLRPEELDALPDSPNVIYLAARKFGSTGDEGLTWAMNTWLPAQVAQRYRQSHIVAFSSGNVYPLVAPESGGATEDTPAGPIGEYAQSVLGRERMFQHFSKVNGTPVALLRLNYAVELRYGVLADVGRKVLGGAPVNTSMGYANVIWQGDANSVCLRSFGICASPPRILNLTGPETLSVREIAAEFGQRFGVQPVIEGTEASTALLNNATRCTGRFGPPRVSVEQMMDWIADWLKQGKESWNKPTHFETRDGKF